MKLTAFLILFTVLSASASVYSQNTKIDLSVERATVRDVFKLIESKTEFRFFYSDDFRDLDREVTLTAKDENINNILSTVLAESLVNYKILENNIIVITPFNLDQNKKITGVIKDAKTGELLAGVNVVIEGTTTGAISNISGQYSIEGVKPESVLSFSFIGYISQKIVVGNKPIIDVSLEPETQSLAEVVVIGYGSRSKKDVTTAISTVSSANIAKTVSMSAELAMQGTMTGVQVTGDAGNPMNRPTIQIRGVNTWGISSPLYVIDGVPVTEFGAGIEGITDDRASDVRGPINIMAMIDPNDIESISVLKDASSAALYGVRASNGVILITTKKGVGDKPVVEFNTRFGVQNIYQKESVLNTKQYAQHLLDAYASDPTVSVSANNVHVMDPNDPLYLGNSPTYDWQNAIRNKNAPTQDYSFSLSGGTNKTDYYLSGGYSNTLGTLVGSSLERYTGSIKLNSQINKYIKVGINYRITSAYGRDNSFLVTYWNLAQTPPWQPIYDPNGPSGYAPTVAGILPDGTYSSTPLYGDGTRLNLLGSLNNDDNKYQLLRNMGTAYVEIEPIKHLKIKGSVSYDGYTNNRYEFSNNTSSVFNYTAGDPRPTGGGTSVGSYEERNVYNNNLVKELTVNYSNSFGMNNIDLLFSAMDQQYGSKYVIASTYYMTDTDPNLRKLGGENKYTSVGSDFSRHALEGLLGRVGYNYNSKYYLDLTLRRDGSNRFAPSNRWGNFPSASAAWRISKEKFMSDLSFINDLKFRAGWGKLGNQEVTDLAYLLTINTNPTYAFGTTPDGRGNFSTGAATFSLPNPSLHWESTATTNIGFDATLFGGLSLSAEYYHKLTSGILQSTNIPESAGVTTQPQGNVASVKNTGIEISLNYSGTVGDFHFTVGGNLSTVNNVVTKTYNDIPFSTALGRIEEGYSMDYIYGYKVGGIFQTQADVDAWKAKYTDVSYQTSKVGPGDMYFQDLRSVPTKPGTFYTNEPDGKIDQYDQVYLGKTIPGFIYGLNFNVDYKGIDFSAQFTGVGDVQAYNYMRAALENVNNTKDNVSTKVLNAWTPENHSTTMPRLMISDPSNAYRFSDRFVEDAGYLRLSNLQIGYTLPGRVYDAVGKAFSNLHIYIGVSNAFTITKYSGFDPENDKYPIPRVFFTGLNVRF